MEKEMKKDMKKDNRNKKSKKDNRKKKSKKDNIKKKNMAINYEPIFEFRSKTNLEMIVWFRSEIGLITIFDNMS